MRRRLNICEKRDSCFRFLLQQTILSTFYVYFNVARYHGDCTNFYQLKYACFFKFISIFEKTDQDIFSGEDQLQ